LKLTLSRKAFLLIAVPLVFELFFVVLLSIALKNAEKAFLSESKSRDTAAAINLILKDFLYGGTGIAFNYLKPGLKTKYHFEQALVDLSKQREHLRQIVGDEGKDDPEFQAFDKILTRAMQTATIGIDSDSNEDSDDGKKFRLFIELQRLLNELNTTSQQILERQDVVQTAQRLTLEKSQTNVQSIMALGILLNILVAVLLAIFFNRATSRRLNVLMRNNVNLALEQPLERIDGEDELAEIDRTFHRMAATLKDARHRERAVLENASDMICSLTRKGKFISVNPAVTNLWGYQPDEIVGRTMASVVVAEDSERVNHTLSNFTQRDGLGSFEAQVIRKDGKKADMLCSVRWVPEEDSLFCVIHDVTERKEIERLKQDLIRMVSHDLRSPLTSLQLTLNLVSSEAFGALSERGHKTVAGAEASVERLIHMINDLLEIEKLEARHLTLNYQIVPVDQVIKAAFENVRSLAESAKVELNYEPSDISVSLDSGRMVQVLTNLIANALKFSNQGTKISVVAREIEDVVEISVADQGRGIPADKLAEVFERFSQVRASDADIGTGLGLAICRAIVEAHGGKIVVTSTEGVGSTFSIRLPKEHASSEF
jgi:PAS domain S-box-containing protein